MTRRFSRIYVEITNMCNLSCSFCVGNTRTPKRMSTHEFAHVLAQAKPFTNHIYLHVLGEPLSHPKLQELLDIAHHLGMWVNITTNGTLLKKTKDVLLHAPALRKISISLHSMEPDSPYSKEEYLQEVALFVAEATKKNVFCELRLWNLGAEDTDNDRIFTSLCPYLGLDHTAQEEIRAKINKSGNTTLAPRLFLGKADRFIWPSLGEAPTEQPIFCHGLRSQMGILSDGTVVPCCLDSRGDIALGNIFETPLVQILNNERAQALYQGFSSRKPTEELCRRCGFAKRF